MSGVMVKGAALVVYGEGYFARRRIRRDHARVFKLLAAAKAASAKLDVFVASYDDHPVPKRFKRVEMLWMAVLEMVTQIQILCHQLGEPAPLEVNIMALRKLPPPPSKRVGSWSPLGYWVYFDNDDDLSQWKAACRVYEQRKAALARMMASITETWANSFGAAKRVRRAEIDLEEAIVNVHRAEEAGIITLE